MHKKYVRVANAVLDLCPYEEYPNVEPGPGMSERLKLNRNESAIGPSPQALKAVKEFLDNRPLNWYPDSEASELKLKISGYTGMPIKNIGCFSGVNSAIDYIVKTFLEPEAEMLINGPVFPRKTFAAKSAGARVTEVIHDDPFSPGIEPVINNLTRQTRLLYIGSPSDTTGSFFTEAELVFLLSYAEQTMLVVDESYFEFSGFSSAELVKKFPNIIIIRSFSHAFGLAALKAAYIISDPENIGYINRLKSENEIDAISQIAAGAVLENDEYMREYVKTVDHSKKILSSNLPEIGYDFFITPANFFLLKVSDPNSARELLEDNGVLVNDLSDIGELNGYLRVTIGVPEDMDKLLLILSRMAQQFSTGFNRNRMTGPSGKFRERIADPVNIK